MSYEDYVVRARNLSKCYALFERPVDRLKQMLWRGRRRYYREFWALRDVSFDVHRGEGFGVIGRNGAGKSTLLQLLCGTITPTAGRVEVNGRIAALLELGAGFNPEFTGRENVYLSASILGFSKQEIDDRFEEIVDFSGIRDFIDQPVKIYSSGMYVRLAFSIATAFDPEILIIDEALSVGDEAFARKSFQRIQAIRERGATLLFCSHAMYHVESLCTRALWLDGGRIRHCGDVGDTIRAYQDFLRASEAVENPSILDGTSNSNSPVMHSEEFTESQRVRVRRWQLTVDGKPTLVARTGSSVELILELEGPACEHVAVAAAIMTPDGRFVTSTITSAQPLDLMLDANGYLAVRLIWSPLLLLRGTYGVRAWVFDASGIFIHEDTFEFAQLVVEQVGREQGLYLQPGYWERYA